MMYITIIYAKLYWVSSGSDSFVCFEIHHQYDLVWLKLTEINIKPSLKVKWQFHFNNFHQLTCTSDTALLGVSTVSIYFRVCLGFLLYSSRFHVKLNQLPALISTIYLSTITDPGRFCQSRLGQVNLSIGNYNHNGVHFSKAWWRDTL